MNKDSNEFDATYPISLFKRNLRSVLCKFESKKLNQILITRNKKPIAVVTQPETNTN